MAGNVFRRFLEIVLDKASAQKTEHDAQASLGRATDTRLATKNVSAFFTATTRIVAQATGAIAGYLAGLNALVERGGQFLNVQRAFGAAVGDSDAALTKLRKATGGLISDYDLMVGFNKALSLGAVQTVDQFGEMSAVAIRLSKALGIDAATAMEKLSLGIGRHSPKILDDLGIIAKQGDSVATILDKARAKADEFGVVSETNADRLNRIKAGFTNLRDEVAKFLATTDTLQVWFFEAGKVMDALVLALQSHDADVVKEAFKDFGALLGSIFVAAFADALKGVFDLLSFEKSGPLSTIFNMAAGFIASGGNPLGALAGGIGGRIAETKAAEELGKLSDAAWSNANAQLVALKALGGQVEAAQKLTAILNPAKTPPAPGGGIVSPLLTAPIPGRSFGAPGAPGISFPGSLRPAGVNEDEFKQLVDDAKKGYANMQSAAEEAAMGMESAFERAFENIGKEGETFGKFIGDILRGTAAAALSGIAQYATGKVAEDVAHAFDEFAAATASGAFGDLPGAALHTAAAHGYLLAAGKWALVGGVAGAAASAASGSGGGSGGLAGSNIVGRQVDNLGNPTGPVIHLHIDGVDPANPRHQALVGRTVAEYEQRYGTKITVNG